MHFTKSQLQAIAHDTGNLQIIACAGSGKTEVVARRVAALLKNGAETKLAPRNIVAFTFTTGGPLAARRCPLAAIALLAAYWPVRQPMRSDPMAALSMNDPVASRRC
jgi:hypothetical protein